MRGRLHYATVSRFLDYLVTIDERMMRIRCPPPSQFVRRCTAPFTLADDQHVPMRATNINRRKNPALSLGESGN